MSKIPFNVDAYTARLIGRENVSKLESALIELIKNTYDADATCCILYYDKKQDTLYLADNGCGMTEHTIRDHWMTIGRSSKKNTFISNGGRIQTGEKGIGRFALDRIADKCQMLTATEKSKTKLLWTVDWKIFSVGKNITEIGAELDETECSFIDFFAGCSNQQVVALVKENWDDQGTIFKLSELRETWGEQLLHDIRSNLSSLIPYELSAVYKIYCFNDHDTIEKAEVSNDLEAFSYDYKIEFEVLNAENKRTKDVRVKLWRAEYDLGRDEDTILKEIGLEEEKSFFHNIPMEKDYLFEDIVFGVTDEIKKRIGVFSGVLYFAKRNTTKRDQERFYQKDITGRVDVRDSFGGIKIYRDNFRVRPYGDPKSSAFDWLQLSRRKAASPAGVASKGTWRVNADQMLGSIFISRMNIMLPDQSNREGIVETPEFLLLQEFIKGILEILEKDRQYIFRILAQYDDQKHRVKTIQDEINRKAVKQKKIKKKSRQQEHINNKDDRSKIMDYEKFAVDPQEAKVVLDAKDEQIEELENEIKMLRVLATTGIVTNTYIHEFKTLSHRLNMKIIMAKEALDMYQDMDEASNYLDQANTIREGFNSWFQVTIDAIKKDKRKRRKTDLVSLISMLVDSWNKTLKLKQIEIIFNRKNKEEIYLKCFPYEIDTIINNLITNSTASFEKARTKERKIYIDIKEENGFIRIDYSDTGAGLMPIYKRDPEKILKVFETDKRNPSGQKIGTGMGLWIVDNTVQDYNGKIDLSKNVTAGSGYYITLFLKRTGVSKNV